MYFINSGSVSVLVDGMEIDRKGIGGFFGEAALVLKQVKTHYIHACIHTYTYMNGIIGFSGEAALVLKQIKIHHIHTYMHTYIHTYTHCGCEILGR